ncbi:hypothetical protein ILUMI_24874 [Ignelater luminosus]|uniref:Uncharacterized protein n=1 Tax=Ignelater luminosus TaxID=2038154 RepID=A0A8K0C9G0_IGNLU|nr:hypothetical protein ILUMI_24874 [Ignelater luminosus]
MKDITGSIGVELRNMIDIAMISEIIDVLPDDSVEASDMEAKELLLPQKSKTLYEDMNSAYRKLYLET